MRSLWGVSALFALWSVAGDGIAQQYPSRPIRLIVGSTGSGDVQARLVATVLRAGLDTSVVVDNRPGANGIVAAEIVSKGTPDGYTLLSFSSGFAINPSVYSKLPFDSVRDFSFIAQTMTAMGILVVNPSLPVRSLPDLIAYARSNPGKILYGSSGVGSPGNLAVELFKLKTKSDLLHVPYKGIAAAVTDLIAGRVQLIITTIPSVLQHVKSGRLHAIAVTGSSRSQTAPELPTMIEAGLPGYTFSNWYGITAPAKMSRPIIAKLNSVIVAAKNDSQYRQQVTSLGGEITASTPDAFAELVKQEIQQWAKVVKFAGIKAEN